MAKFAVRLHMNGSTKAMFIRALSDNGRTGMADALRANAPAAAHRC